MEVKDIIRNRRLELDLTLEQIAQRVGVSKPTVMRWENGDIENMRADKIAKLAKALNTTPVYLMGWTDEKEIMDLGNNAKDDLTSKEQELLEAFRRLLPEMQNFFYNLKRENKQILGYIGGHALSNALDVLIDAMALIKNKDIVAVFVGKGNEKEKLMNDANKQGLNNVYFLDPVDKRMVPSLLKEMDVLYLGGKNQPLYQYGTSQTKLFDYMQAAKPVIQTISPPNNYVAEAQCGITIVGDGALAVANGIEKMMNYSKQELGEMGMRGKLYCYSHFNYRKLSFDFMKYINE